jgi:Mrp family chromosome partitioning ATPase
MAQPARQAQLEPGGGGIEAVTRRASVQRNDNATQTRFKMDRIREAVIRARNVGEAANAQNASVQPAARQPETPSNQPPRTPSNRFGDIGSADASRFARIACDFDRFAQNRIISNEQDPVLNAYRVLRTRVLQKMEENNWRTLAVVSPGSGVGKTVTAINLAIAIGSKEGSRSTLVDLDFYRPRIASYLGFTTPPSILDFFEGKQSLEAVTVRPDLTDTLVIANERVTRRGAEYLTSPKADELIDLAVRDFRSRVVIFDLSPLLGCDDAIAFLPKVDCVLLVAASGQTRVHELKEAKRILSRSNLVGSVLNKAPAALTANAYY